MNIFRLHDDPDLAAEPYWWDEYRFLVQQNGLEIANDKNDGVKV